MKQNITFLLTLDILWFKLSSVGVNSMRKRLLTIKQLSQYLQYEEGTIYNLVNQGKIPYIKLSRKALRFEQEKIDAWIKERAAENIPASKEPTEELEKQLSCFDALRKSFTRHFGPQSKEILPTDTAGRKQA